MRAASNMEMDLAEIEEKYASKWVAIKVTKRDEIGQPVKGEVLCQHLDRKMLSHELNGVAEKDVCIFQALTDRRGVLVMI